MSSPVGTIVKGAIFLAELKRRLFSEGFTLAIPEPDLGDDLWIVDANETESQMLRRCQIKSALVSKREPNRYTVNFTTSFRSRLDSRFYFIVGLYEGDDIHLACFPSSYFKSLDDQNRLRINRKGRPILDFFLERAENPDYWLRVKPTKRYAREPRELVTRFFLGERKFSGFVRRL